ncbi:MAG: membrane protein insertase YidC [Gallionellaceae bacterium]|jgi:YidC/Oxa1 family membrane protein insertase|nr:membrane protein insertase YidC [Gallionellaceae bacterium]
MDTRRLFLFLIFFLSIFLLWDSWQRFQHPAPPVVAKDAVPQGQTAVVSGDSASTGVPAATAQAPALPAQEAATTGQKIKVKTDWLYAEIDTNGGSLRRLDFLRHHDTLDRSKPFSLLQQRDAHTYIAQAGLLGTDLPNHNTQFSAETNEYQIADGQDALVVRLSAATNGAEKINKIYTFHRSSYVIDVAFEIENTGAEPLSPFAYFQLVRDQVPPAEGSKFLPTYTGPAVYTDQEKFQKVHFSDIDKGKIAYPNKTNDGWVGMLQHYFVAAWFLNDKTPREFYTTALKNGLYSAGMKIPVATIAPGQTGTVSVPLYAGPATSSLDNLTPGLGLTVDYGWLTILSTPLFWVLSFLQGWVQNWGIAIILLTILIKLLFFPLSAASYRSMAKMRVVAPKLEKIKQQYGEDKERLHKARMELYQTEKINPLGGCLPMIVQIPVFIALYWAILASVELRYAPFFGWIQDLSAPDPYYILPLIMGASMIIQSRLSPAPPDPMQAKIMRTMPIVFSVVFFFFPAGLVLYSIVNNVLSIAQQWVITRRLENKGVAAS